MGATSRQPSALSLRDVPRSAPQGALAPSPESYAVEGATQPHEAFEKLLKACPARPAPPHPSLPPFPFSCS